MSALESRLSTNFRSASDGNSAGGPGGRPPVGPDFGSASERNPSGGPGGRPPVEQGATLWFTGLPSAGKSTIAYAVAERLTAAGRRVQVLDGDEVRPHLSAGLGYSRADRDVNVRRIGWVARLLAGHGVVVLVPVIAPYASAREAVRADHAAAGVAYAEVYVSTALEVAEARDVKGLYARARRGELQGLTGLDDPYERPDRPELSIDTARVDVATAAERSAHLLAAITEGVAR